MTMLFYSWILLMMISMMISLLSNSLAFKPIKDRQLSSAFECGFNPLSSGRLHFSIRFFLITLIFLVFDAEILLIIPLSILDSKTLTLGWALGGSTFILFLFTGVIFEMTEGMLDWSF